MEVLLIGGGPSKDTPYDRLIDRTLMYFERKTFIVPIGRPVVRKVRLDFIANNIYIINPKYASDVEFLLKQCPRVEFMTKRVADRYYDLPLA